MTERKGFRWPLQISVTIKPLNERHFVTLAIIGLIILMLLMAREDPELWKVELFKTLLTAFSITGFLNMVTAFHFSATKGDEAKTDNTAKAFDAITATASAAGAPGDLKAAAVIAADKVADAAVVAADKVKVADAAPDDEVRRD